MDIKQLQYILAIAQEQGVSKAAEKLFITQSALDQQLLKLERELGVQLFFRSKNSFGLTDAGQVYVAYAKKIVELKNEAYRKIQDLADQARGTLAVAFAPERGMEMFMDIYPGFYAAYPGVTVVPREMRVRQQLELLAGGELDLGFVSMKKESAPSLACIPVVREQFVLIAPLHSPLGALCAPEGAPLAVLGPERLTDVHFSLMYRESTQREVIDALFQKWGLRPSVFLETASNRANISMVEKGLSCSIVPYWYVKDCRSVARFRLKGEPTWNICICHPRGRYLSRATRDFMERARVYLLKEHSSPL